MERIPGILINVIEGGIFFLMAHGLVPLITIYFPFRDCKKSLDICYTLDKQICN